MIYHFLLPFECTESLCVLCSFCENSIPQTMRQSQPLTRVPLLLTKPPDSEQHFKVTVFVLDVHKNPQIRSHTHAHARTHVNTCALTPQAAVIENKGSHDSQTPGQVRLVTTSSQQLLRQSAVLPNAPQGHSSHLTQQQCTAHTLLLGSALTWGAETLTSASCLWKTLLHISFYQPDELTLIGSDFMKCWNDEIMESWEEECVPIFVRKILTHVQML